MSSSFTVNREELAWAAGFFDGEGYVGVSEWRGKNKSRAVLSLVITQVDRRVLDRFRAAVGGLGAVYGPFPGTTKRARPLARYHVSHIPRVQAICAMIWTWLSPVKREQFKSAIATTNASSVPLCEHRLRPFKCMTCRRRLSVANTRRYVIRKTAHALLVAV